jgi:hypothetical protein
MRSAAIDLESMGRRQSPPVMQKNQGLGEGPIIMCKSCGKRCFEMMYPLNSLI